MRAIRIGVALVAAILLGGGASHLPESAQVASASLSVGTARFASWGSWGAVGSGPGELSSPGGVAVSPDGRRVYIADTGNRRVSVFTSSGIFLQWWPLKGGGAPQDVAVGNGSVYAIDETGRVERFDPAGRLVDSWRAASYGGPTYYSISASPNGRVYVALQNQYREASDFSTYSADGRVLDDVTLGALAQLFPSGAVDTKGNYYGVGVQFAKDPVGNTLYSATVVRGAAKGGSPTSWLDRAQYVSSSSPKYWPPRVYGIAVDPTDGSVYVGFVSLAYGNVGLERLTPDLVDTGVFASYLPRAGWESDPAIDCRSYLYVLDPSDFDAAVHKYGPPTSSPVCRPSPLDDPDPLVFGSPSRVGERVRVPVGCEIRVLCLGEIVLRLPDLGVVGRARFRIRAGTSKAIAIRVDAPGRRALAEQGRAPVRLEATLRGGRRVAAPAVLRRPSSLSLACPAVGKAGEALSISGRLQPALVGATVKIFAASPVGETVVTPVRTVEGGRFSANVTPSAGGTWQLTAEWLGDRRHQLARARACSLEIASPPPPPPAPPPKAASSLSLTCDPTILFPGDSITVTGTLSPAHKDARIEITFRGPGDTKYADVVTTDETGYFADNYGPIVSGDWTVRAHWDGDSDHESADSPSCSFVLQPP